MNFREIYTGLLVLSLLCLCTGAAAQGDTQETIVTDDIAAYNGPLGPGSPLYGLKLALENMDESFTADETERVSKQMEHARLRLSEVRGSLEMNRGDSAEEALNNYWLKMDLANVTIARWRSNTTGLLHAQEQVVKHQLVLENLLAGHPNNTGLMRAYNNSLQLEEKFGEKTMMRFNRTVDRNNQTIMKAIRLGQKEHGRTAWPEGTVTATPETTTQQAGDRQKGWEKDMDKGKGPGNQDPVIPVTTQTTRQQGTQGQGNGQDDRQGSGNNPDDKGSGNAGGNSGGQGKGNPKGK